MSSSLNIAAIVLAMTLASGYFDEALIVSGMTPAAQGSVTGSDPVTYAAQYGSVIDWVGPTGTILNDPAAITALYTFLFSNVFAGTTRISTIRNLTFLSGTIAVLDIETEVIGFARALEKNVLIKRAGEWRILLHQQTLVSP
jgi:hypothetical protein